MKKINLSKTKDTPKPSGLKIFTILMLKGTVAMIVATFIVLFINMVVKDSTSLMYIFSGTLYATIISGSLALSGTVLMILRGLSNFFE